MSQTQQPIQVVISTDRNYLPHAGAMVASLLMNMAADDRVIVHVMHGGLAEPDMASLRQVFRLRPDRCEVIFHHVTSTLLQQIPLIKHLTIAAYYRLLMEDILSDLQRVIYLDVDMIVRHSLAELWSIDLHGKLVGVVEDSDSFAVQYDQMGLAPGVRFNSGVMLCDLHAMRQLPLWENYQQALDRFGDRLLAGEQDLLNHVMADKTLIIPCIWNNTSSVYREVVRYQCYNDQQVWQAISDPVIVHFTGRRKPWQLTRDRHRYAMEYWHYLAHTPWRSRCWRKFVKLVFLGRKDQPGTSYQILMRDVAKKATHAD